MSDHAGGSWRQDPKRVGTNAPSLQERIRHGGLIGRDREVEEARVWFGRALQGEGSILLISGEPGIGKTRLADELARRARDDGFITFTGACYGERGSPLSPITQMVRAGLRHNPAMAARLPEFPYHVLSRNSAETRDPSILSTPVLRHERILDAAGEWFDQACAVTPILMVLEDIHWACDTVLELLVRLGRMARHLPFIMVFTYRPSDYDRTPLLDQVLVELNRERLAVNLRLDRLNRAETHRLLTSLAIEGAGPEFIENLYRQTEGNPFFVEEVCKTLVEEGHLIGREGRWHLEDTAVIKLPHTVRSALQARIGRLTPEAQDVLRLASIQGHVFSYEILKRSSGGDEDMLITALEDAARALLIEEMEAEAFEPGRRQAGSGQPRSGALQYRFVHVLIPLTLRESMMRLRRNRLHLQVAQAIEDLYPDEYEILAYHYTEAADEERARAYAVRAGDRLLNTIPTEAARYYRAALAGWTEADPLSRAGLLANLARCLWITGELQAALATYNEANALFIASGDITQSGEMQRMIGRIYWEQADRDQAMAHYLQAIQLHDQQPGSVEQALAISSISQMYMLADENELAIQWGQKALDLAERLGAEEVRVHALNNVGSSMARNGDLARGRALLDESTRRSVAAGLPIDAIRARYNLASILHHEGRYGEELDLLDQLHQEARKVDSRSYAYLAVQRLAWLNWLIGNWGRGLEFRARLGNTSAELYWVWTQTILGLVDIDLGRYELACRELEEGLEGALKANEIHTTLPHLHQLARVYSALGMQAEAEAHIRRIYNFLHDKLGSSDQHGRLYLAVEGFAPVLYCGQWLAEQPGQASLAQAYQCRDFLVQSLEIIYSPEADASIAEITGSICMAEGRPVEAAGHFQRAAGFWEQIGRRYDQARALLHQGQASQAAGVLPGAKSAFGQAFGIYQNLAEQLDEAARDSFLRNPPVAQAAQWRQDHPPRRSSLSPREVQVAHLVRQGLTNKAIADELVISERTVEKHVENIMNRLGFNSRAQIAAWMVSEEGAPPGV